jgi:hypothetical protein
MNYEEFSELFKPLNDAIKEGKIIFDIDPDLYNYIMSDEYLKDNDIHTIKLLEAEVIEQPEKEKA